MLPKSRHLQGTVYINVEDELQNYAPEKPPQESKLNHLVEKSQKVVFEAHSVFPFTLFPNRISVCLNRVTITYQNLFAKEEFPLLIENITGARIFRSFLFSSLLIDTFGLKSTPDPLKYLKHKDARFARRYILALIECKKSDVDLSVFSLEEIREKLKTIGMVRESVRTQDTLRF